MTTPDPCNICGGDVRLEQREKPRRLGEKVAQTGEARVCTNPGCPSNTGTRKLGQTV